MESEAHVRLKRQKDELEVKKDQLEQKLHQVYMKFKSIFDFWNRFLWKLRGQKSRILIR